MKKYRIKTRTRQASRGNSGRALASIGGYLLYFAKWLVTPNLKLRKLEKYVFSEVWSWFLMGAMAFTFFMTITSVFMLGEKIFSKKIPIYTTLKVLILSAPAFLVLALPVAMLFATLMAMGRLSRDNEVTMFVASGVSLYSIFTPFLCLALYNALLTWSIYEYMVPANNREFTKVLAVFWDSQVVDFIRPGVIIKAPDNRYFYIDQVDRYKDRMYNLRLYDFSGTRPNPRLFLAEEAWVENKYLNLNKVRVIETDQSRGFVIASAVADKTAMDISRRFGGVQYDKSPQELSSRELLVRIKERADIISKYAEPPKEMANLFWTDFTEYYFKFSIPFASVVFVMVAVPLSLRGPRDERNLGIIQAFILLMVYYILFFSFRVLGSTGEIPAIVAGWVPTVVFVVMGIILIIRARK